MSKLGIHEIRKLAKGIINAKPGGIRYTQLVDAILQQTPDTPRNTVHGSVWNLEVLFPNEISKPTRGLYKPAGADAAVSAVVPETVQTTAEGKRVKESDFYEPFAEWLKNDLDEVTDVAALGGAGLRSKWGTPDVIGVYKPLASNLIKFPLEVVSAEIKIDPQQPVVAFGQAVAYRLFSAKTYIGMPTALTEEDQGRLEALCMLFGVGLVLFDVDVENPNFSIRVRAQRFSPDMFYVNEFADRLKVFDADVFEKLFR
ncbi:MAG: hypothetical protein ABSH20_06215 [Tepidisphaeraceae bacterium]|jgi:hypothetical protein